MAQRVGRVIALLFHDHGTRRGWAVSSTPRPYFTPGKDPVPIIQEAGWIPGPVWTSGKSRTTGIVCAWVDICNVGTKTLLHFDLCPAVACFNQLQAGNTTKRTHNSTMPHTNLRIVLQTQSMTRFYWHGYVVLSPYDCTVEANFHNINRYSPSSILWWGIFCAHM